MITLNSNGNALSPDFLAAVAQPLVAFDVQLVDGGAPVGCVIRSLSLSLGDAGDSDAGAGLPMGGVFSSSLSARLAECTAPLLGHELEVRVGVDVGGPFEHVTVAWATVTSSWTAAGETSIQAVGRIAAMMTACPLGLAEGAYPPQAVASAIAAASGVPVALGSFASTAAPVAVTGSESCRAALGSLAMALGGFAAESGEGVLVAPLPDASPTHALSADLLRALPQLSESAYEVDGLTVTAPADTSGWDGEGEEPQDVVYAFGTGRVAVEDADATAESAAALWANVGGRSWRPGTVTVSVLDPRLTPFDVVSVPLDGGEYPVPSLGIQATYDGGWFGSFSASGPSEAAEAAYQVGPLESSVGQAREASRLAVAASSRAEDAAARAVQDAATAKEAADSAVRDAGTAKQAAEDAQTAAGEAKADASEAKSSAARANRYSTAALDQLSVVQDVAGILAWASEHGRFERTTDAEPQEGTVYFAWDSASGDYAPVVEPDAADMASYHVLTVGEAMNDFIMAHLAVTGRGLWVLPSGMGDAADAQHAAGYKMLLAADGAYIYDADGALVRSDTASGTDFSPGNAFHIGNDDAYILYTPASGTAPAGIVIGGPHVQLGSSKTLSEWEADMARAVGDAAAARDSATIAITSTRGFLFKNGAESTVLQVAVFPAGGGRLDTIGDVRARFGAGAYIEWRWMHEGSGDWGVLASSDPHLSQGGMWLTVSPGDVETKTTFEASLVTP